MATDIPLMSKYLNTFSIFEYLNGIISCISKDLYNYLEQMSIICVAKTTPTRSGVIIHCSRDTSSQVLKMMVCQTFELLIANNF